MGLWCALGVGVRAVDGRAPRERGQNVVSDGADARAGVTRSRAKYPN